MKVGTTFLVAMGLIQASAQAQEGVVGSGGAAVSTAPVGSLRGVTLDGKGVALAEVVVTIHGEDGGADDRQLTDANGVFWVRDLRPGSYRLTAGKIGFQAITSP